MKKYWFRPKRFWKVFAAYYPTSLEGWVVSILLGGVLVAICISADLHSHSVSDMLLAAAPGALIVMLLFDLVCFRTGEYPSWWKRRG